MIIRSSRKPQNEIAAHLGGEWSMIASILRGGTGSVRIIYTGGIKEFDEVALKDLSLSFCNIQIYKKGFAIRLIKKGNGQVLGIKFGELKRLVFISTPIRIHLRGRTIIRHKAEVIINCIKVPITLQVLQVHYKSFKEFVIANFNKEIIDWSVLPIEDDEDANAVNLISRLIN